MPINYDIDGLLPCPICKKSDKLYIGYSDYSEHEHITCIRCEIDTWSHHRSKIKDVWNKLPRKE